MATWQLKRTVQCAKCPWKVSTNPHEIPHGYDLEKHKELANTIAVPGDYSKLMTSDPIRIMACHHSYNEAPEHCIGWLMHQLGVGNNIPLRMSMRNCTNIDDVVLVGEQHERFEDTLPAGAFGKEAAESV